jgi:hypothetical protein
MTTKDDAIIGEIQKALARLGASPVLIYRAAAMRPAALYEEFERLGAPPKLLGAIGSWDDTLYDDTMLDFLRTWNESDNIKLS